MSELYGLAAVILFSAFAVFMSVIAYWFWQIGRTLHASANVTTAYDLVHELGLTRYVLKKHDINLDKERMKRKFTMENKKSFRGRLHDEVYDDFFGKDIKK